MRAVVISQPVGIEGMEIREVPKPEARGDQVRVRVVAAGLNRADLMQAKGQYPAPKGAPADIPGLEFAGEVDALGPDCAGGLKVGDRVYGIVGGGGLAEYVVTHERLAVGVPTGLSWAEAGAVPESFCTALDALDQSGVRPGETVLVHAATGGVGSAAVLIARAMGCRTIGTSRTAAKLERAREELGLDEGISAGPDTLAAAVKGLTGGRGVPAVVDHLGGAYLGANLEALAVKGTIVVVGLLAGGVAENLDLGLLLRKRARVVGTVLRARPLEEKIEATTRMAETVGPWLERGVVRPIVDAEFPIDQIREAAGRMASNEGFGKIVVRM
jgi:putative PIG3 family NAD(P)H quinone oxidoreductase